MSKNDVTGDSIKTKVSDQKKYDEGFDRIWGKKEVTLEGAIEYVKSVTKPQDEVFKEKK